MDSAMLAALFMAGYIPGILWGVGCMILTAIMAKKRGYVNTEKYTAKTTLKALWEGVPSLLMIVIVIGGILNGWFTATEGSAIAVAYSLILGFIYRNIKIKDLPGILLSSVKTTAVIEFLVCVSSIMSWVMSFAKIPQMISSAMLGISSNPIVLLIIMNIVLLIVGTFMDPTPAVLIFTPIFLPIVQAFGMHPVHFGLMMVMNLCVGTLTPPVGAILFAGCRIANVKIEQVIKTLLPFFGVVLIALLLVTYIPFLSLAIPNALNLVNLDDATAYGVQVCNVPDYGTNEVADHALALTLTLARKVHMIGNMTKDGVWNYAEAVPVHRMSTRTVGIIGAGRIGQAYAQRVRALGCKVIAFDAAYGRPGFTAPDFIEFRETADQVLAEADIISLHCGLNEQTKSMMNDDAFGKMKEGSYFVNVAQGGLVDEEALERALSSGKLAGAGIDVVCAEPLSKDSPLFNHPNVVITPHMAWYSEEAALELKRKCAEEAVRFLKGEPPRYPVNTPKK